MKKIIINNSKNCNEKNSLYYVTSDYYTILGACGERGPIHLFDKNENKISFLHKEHPVSININKDFSLTVGTYMEFPYIGGLNLSSILEIYLYNNGEIKFKINGTFLVKVTKNLYNEVKELIELNE